MRLVYVFDAYCGWCHGFATTIREVAARHPHLPIEVVSGGLFVGERRVPIGRFGYIDGANAKISEITGARFGAGYQRLIADGSFVMDSEAAARGFAALRTTGTHSPVELAEIMQSAFYLDGHSLSEPGTYRLIATSAGLDADAVVEAFQDPASLAAAHADFERAARLGATGFPTLVAIRGDEVVTLARGNATADEVTTRIAALG
ncbi:DsbA family protein [Actinoplanes couchii]|uniref:DsbA family protein n=1 Tax=Actinoplanes couchii TaxID=403638 RepID=A0ABQ3XR63_9ACTN|nr:DsbA family protein [Actinoplanes couchii]MDR6318206.1 putative protein-disulfide isomerase [Actinoplanes couchii]GID61000.1 DsbA family protein [Actinoplanes couchii]